MSCEHELMTPVGPYVDKCDYCGRFVYSDEDDNIVDTGPPPRPRPDLGHAIGLLEAYLGEALERRHNRHSDNLLARAVAEVERPRLRSYIEAIRILRREASRG